MRKLKLFTLFMIFFWLFASAQVWAYCEDPELQKLAILSNGRIKPLVVHAHEILKVLTDKSPRSDRIAVERYCKLAFHLPEEIKVHVDHVDLQKFLGLPGGEKFLAMEELQAREQKLGQEYLRLQAEKQEKSSYGKSLSKILYRLHQFQAIDDGSDWTIPINAAGSESDWITLTQFRSQYASGAPEEVVSKLKLAGQQYLRKLPGTVGQELTYHRLHLITFKVFAALISLIVVFLVQKKKPKTQFWVGSIAMCVVLALTFVDLYYRIIISGRGPVTNMYETVLWVGMGIALFATILAFVKREPAYFLFGLAGLLLTVFMNRFAPSMVDPSIQPLVPVLRDNFWLSTHVTSVTISYAAFALSWIIANAFMVQSILGKSDGKKSKNLNDLAYAAIKIGVVLIAAGTILGGIWADYSWGRFWGWDPKETWALITLLIYVGILHGRYAGWIAPKVFLPAVGLAFLSVLMCWFGVNYVLAAGLHSYGWSENGTIFLVSIFVLQFLIFGIHMFMMRAKSS